MWTQSRLNTIQVRWWWRSSKYLQRTIFCEVFAKNFTFLENSRSLFSALTFNLGTFSKAKVLQFNTKTKFMALSVHLFVWYEKLWRDNGSSYGLAFPVRLKMKNKTTDTAKLTAERPHQTVPISCCDSVWVSVKNAIQGNSADMHLRRGNCFRHVGFRKTFWSTDVHRLHKLDRA